MPRPVSVSDCSEPARAPQPRWSPPRPDRSLCRQWCLAAGRPDLAGEFLRLVFQPTLLIVGGYDATVIELNRNATQVLPVETRLEIVPGATHLFEEPGALEQVARLAGDWFLRHLKPLHAAKTH